MNPLLIAIGGLLVLFVIFGFFYGVYLLINPTRTAGDRLRDMTDSNTVQDEMPDILIESGDSDGVLSTIARLAAPATEEEKKQVRRQLIQAGYKHRHALEIYNGVRVTAAICLPLFVGPFAAGLSFGYLAGAVLVAAAAGYYLPAIIVTNASNKRKTEILNAFPDCLDLLVSSVEAGLGLDAAFRRVAGEMDKTSPAMSHEFKLVNYEISAGVPRVEALRHLEERTGVDEIRGLVNMLAQAERFGTSVAKSLRVHAKMSREKRMARAEEKAAQVSPKMTVVMIIFLLPVLISVLLGPALIRVMQTLSGTDL